MQGTAHTQNPYFIPNNSLDVRKADFYAFSKSPLESARFVAFAGDLSTVYKLRHTRRSVAVKGGT